MSVLIKGMDMPKNCMDCPLFIEGVAGEWCYLAEKFRSIADTRTRPEWCPLEEVDDSIEEESEKRFREFLANHEESDRVFRGIVTETRRLIHDFVKHVEEGGNNGRSSEDSSS